jgi:dihydrofolate synthase/folylpolyglutamate synthase
VSRVGEFRDIEEAIEWITHLFPKGEKPGLRRMKLLMEKLGHPERQLEFIHVAGTNGKGSTCALLTSVLLAGGYRVGTFTSPYLVRFSDRIRYNGANILDDTLLDLINRVKPIADEIAATELLAPTMFDVATALAILYYATVVQPDVVVWETGIGGRVDPTNIVTPLVSIITNIGFDHMEMLGDTVEKITFEKAGIIKPGVPVVCAAEQPEALAVIREQAELRGSAFYVINRDFAYESVRLAQEEHRFHYLGPFRRINNMQISMHGEHQLKNAAAALTAMELLRQDGWPLKDDALRDGLSRAAWPGRLEMVSAHPRILLDGAHNPEGAQALSLALQRVYRYNRLHVMMGMLGAKNHPGYLGHILPLADTLVITEPDWHKKLNADSLAEIAVEELRRIGRTTKVVTIPDWRDALDYLRTVTAEDDLAVITGTLYLISDVRSVLVEKN